MKMRVGVMSILGLLGASTLLLSAPASSAGKAAGCHQARGGTRRPSSPGIARPCTAGVRNGSRGRPARCPASRRHRPSIRTLDLSRPALRTWPGRLRQESAAATRDKLSRMSDAKMVKRFRRAGLLVPVPANARTYYVSGVRASLRVARPWTKRFIEQVSLAFQHLFAQRLRITSLTRTRAVQQRLLRTNLGAAPARGPVQSTHLTGAAVDVSKRSLSRAQVAWLRAVLVRLRLRGLIHVVEEFHEPHFHVMVRRRYRKPELSSAPRRAGGC
jgi:hypothetical protein